MSTLGASTFLGIGSSDVVRDIIVANGSVYAILETDVTNFPKVSSGYNSTLAENQTEFGVNGFLVVKLSPDLSQLQAQAILGGANGAKGTALAVDAGGNIYVTGYTTSYNFPTTAGAYDTSYAGWEDAFIVRLSPDLKNLLASTLLSSSGFGTEKALDIAIDSSGSVFVVGNTDSSSFPTTNSAYKKTFSGYEDAFVSKFNSSLTTLVASTYIGGGAKDQVMALTINQSNEPYLAGYTHSQDFLVNSYDKVFNGSPVYEDGFITRLNTDLSSIIASTYIGGSSADVIEDVLLDASGNVYIAGWTSSNNFPVSPGAYDTSLNGQVDAFIAKFSPALNMLLASTYLGGATSDVGEALAIDKNGNIFVAGATYPGSNFPVSPGSYDTTATDSEEAFITKLSSNLQLVASSYLGGSSTEKAYALAVDSSDNLYVAGLTQSSDFPVSPSAYQKIYGGNGNWDGFISVFGGSVFPKPLSNPPEVKKGSNLQIIASGSLPDLFISSFYNVETNATVILAPIVILEKNGYTLVSYNTNELVTGTYTLKIKDEIQQTIIAESQLIQVVPEKIVFKLNAPKTSVIKGSDVVVKVYPGLYAYDKLVSSEYAIIWKDSKGNTLPVVPSVWPSKGFTLLLPFVYNTSVIEPGTYKVELRENKKLGQLLASTFVTIIENELGESMQPAYNPRAFAQYQQSLKKGRPLVTR